MFRSKNLTVDDLLKFYVKIVCDFKIYSNKVIHFLNLIISQANRHATEG